VGQVNSAARSSDEAGWSADMAMASAGQRVIEAIAVYGFFPRRHRLKNFSATPNF
jgi:hypothetical protein